MQVDLTQLPTDIGRLHAVVRDLAGALEAKERLLVEQAASLESHQRELEKLRLLLAQLRRAEFGRRSERLDADQLQLGLEDLEQAVATAEAARDALPGGGGA